MSNGLTCPGCKAPVSSASTRCAVCGADLSVAKIRQTVVTPMRNESSIPFFFSRMMSRAKGVRRSGRGGHSGGGQKRSRGASTSWRTPSVYRLENSIFVLLCLLAGVLVIQSDLISGKPEWPKKMPAAGAEARPPSDGFIKVEVYGRLRMDDAVDVGGINVDVDDGIVHLSGDVKSGYAKGRAESLARSVAGVRGLRSEITVRQ